MTVTGVDDFLQAEEQAHLLVDQLHTLAQEMAHYKAAHEALDDASTDLGELTTRLGALTQDVGKVFEALHAIGTPEILAAQREIAQAHSQEIQALTSAIEKQTEMAQERGAEIQELRATLEAQAAQTSAALRTVRHLAAGGLALSLLAVALMGWLALALSGA